MNLSESAAALGARLDHRFADLALLDRALTHRSWANEHAPCLDNESLALLGDAVLALVVSEHLWRGAPDARVGELTIGRADLVSGVNLARWAEQIGLGQHLKLGRGEAIQGGQSKESVLATAIEAVLAVVYLEGGLSAAQHSVAALAVW